MPLTDVFCRKVKPEEKSKKYFDGGSMYLLVTKAGGKLWRLDYNFDGKYKTLSMGKYPELSLKDARIKCAEAKELLARGIDPCANKAAQKAANGAREANSFEIVAREWFSNTKEKWVEAHAVKVIARLENYIFPIIGRYPVGNVPAQELLKALRAIEARGANDTAHRALQSCGQIFRFAIATGRAERNIAADLKDALQPVVKNNFATITNPQEIDHLLKAIDNYNGNIIVRTALRLAPYVFVRPKELRFAEWEEFDFNNSEWVIPAAKMKMRDTHIVPLSRQVIELLADLYNYTGNYKYLFPSLRAKSKPISDATLLHALRTMGFSKEKMTVHGFRSMASTCLNKLGYNPDWIERQLAHCEHNKVRAAYNHFQYMDERKRMMQEWADYLDKLKYENNLS